MKKNSFGWHSLRLKIVLFSVLIEIVLLSILVWNSTRIAEESLIAQSQNQLVEILPILNAALSPSMLAEDVAALRETLTKIIAEQSINYAAIYNSFDEKLFESGLSRTSNISSWGRNYSAHLLNEGIDAPYRMRMPILIGGFELGHLDIELDAQFIKKTTLDIHKQGFIIAGIEVLLSILLLSALGFMLTRKLYVLTDTAQKMSTGDLSVRANIPGHDEVSATADAFNMMASSIFKQTSELHKKQERLNTLLDSMEIAIVFENKEGVIEYYNAAFIQMWRLPHCININGLTLESLQNITPNKILRTSKPELDNSRAENQKDIYLDNDQIINQSSRQLLTGDKKHFGRLWMFEDITKKHKSRQDLAYLAEHDALTGLFNRYKFQLELENMTKTIQRHHQMLVLFYFDLDEFKAINDNYGHEQGDQVLIKIAKEISSIVRSEDVFSRIGGDEFAILTKMNDHDETLIFAERIIQTISRIPFNIKNKALRITSSLGISSYPDLSLNPTDLQAHADIAMYVAKNKGKNAFSIYDSNGDNMATSLNRLSWNERIDRAFDNDLFELHFQGIYHVKDRSIAHLECLIRLKDEENLGQLLSPAVFIPYAEKSGKILDIDKWVITQAITLLASSPDVPPLAINISGRSFDQKDLPKFIGNLISLNSVDPQRLLVELTETEAVSDLQDARIFIEALHDIGCLVCLDDFGSGFSSFAYLKHIQVDVLKIDGIFIEDLDSSYENQLFVESMVHVAKGMKQKTVAEFVENEAIFNTLEGLGITYAQGYYLDKPSKQHPALP